MEITKPAEALLEALRHAGAGRAKIDLEEIRGAFLNAFPQWQGSADRRERLRTLLDELSQAERLRLPANLKRGWEQLPAPALPTWALIVRADEVIDDSFDHRVFPWVEAMAFIAGLRTIGNSNELRRIHDFLKNHPERRPIVPVKERSFQLFGDEKRLDTLRKSKLFEDGRLTLELLRCRDVPASLPCVPTLDKSSGAWLIVENEAAFDSFSRLNRILSVHAGIVLGSGRNVLRAVDFLATLVASSPSENFLYFGDIDRDGIEIPALLDQRVRKRTGQRVLPAEQYYHWLLAASEVEATTEKSGNSIPAVSWFSVSLRPRIAAALNGPRPLVQEAIGWEFLSSHFKLAETDGGALPAASQGLGGSPHGDVD